MNIKVFDSRFNQLIDTNRELEKVATGFEFTEGPIWHPQEKSLIFSDIIGNAIYHWTAETGARKLRHNSYMANGNTYDHQWRVVTCEHATSRITRTDFLHHGELEVLATHYQGKELNSPNDIICKRDGTLYFSDPNMGRGPRAGVPRQQQLTFQGVYRLDPSDRSLVLLVDDFTKPNGLCFSNDEKRLFIDDSEFNHIRVFDVASDGYLHNGRLLADLTRAGIGVADGMKMDPAGNIYCCGPGGVHIFDANANYLGIVLMPEQTANLAWGDDDLNSLYITASTSVYRIRTLVSGFPASNSV
jgi:gluconolactonase